VLPDVELPVLELVVVMMVGGLTSAPASLTALGSGTLDPRFASRQLQLAIQFIS
jgi:hypothetical protein